MMATRGRPKGTTNANKGIEQSTKITMRITNSDLSQIDQAARELRISRSALLRLAVFKLIKEAALNQ